MFYYFFVLDKVNIGRSSPSSLNNRLSRIKQRMTQTQRKPSTVKSELEDEEEDNATTWSPDGTFFELGEFEDLPSTAHSFDIEPNELRNRRLVDVLTQVCHKHMLHFLRPKFLSRKNFPENQK